MFGECRMAAFVIRITIRFVQQVLTIISANNFSNFNGNCYYGSDSVIENDCSLESAVNQIFRPCSDFRKNSCADPETSASRSYIVWVSTSTIAATIVLVVMDKSAAGADFGYLSVTSQMPDCH